MRVSEIELSDPAWADLVASHPDAGPFHLPEWASVITDCYRFRGFVLGVREGNELVAGVPVIAVRSPLGALRWVSLPFSDVCAPLVREGIDPASVVESLRDHVLAAGVRELELRAELPDAENAWPEQVGYYHELVLPTDESGLRPNKGHRNLRNRAMREGVQIVHSDTRESLDAFYHLHTLTRRRHGVPVQSRRFFDLVFDRMIREGHGLIGTATLDGEILAASIFLFHNGILTAKYHASDPRHLNIPSGYLMDWESMVQACRRGFRVLDFGRSDLDADGLRLYKSSWGIPERPLVYTHISRERPGSAPARSAEWYKPLIRHSPLWVCRALGAVFYRWAA